MPIWVDDEATGWEAPPITPTKTVCYIRTSLGREYKFFGFLTESSVLVENPWTRYASVSYEDIDRIIVREEFLFT